MLGALVRWAEVDKYKVSKHCYISLPSPSQHPLDQRSTDAGRLIIFITNGLSVAIDNIFQVIWLGLGA